MPAPKKNPLTKLIKKGAKKAVVKVKPKPNVKAEPKSNVKKVKGKTTAPKTGLENRGRKPTKRERSEQARNIMDDKADREFDAELEMFHTGLKTYPRVFSEARGPGKKNLRKSAALKKQASPRIIKITGR